MKKLVSLGLYIVYLVAAWIPPMVAQSAEKTFNASLVVRTSILVTVICTLILITRPHLTDRSRTPQNLLLYGAYTAVSAVLMIWGLHAVGGSFFFLLLALLTENIYEFVTLLVKSRG